MTNFVNTQRVNLSGLPVNASVTKETLSQLVRDNSDCQLITFIDPAAWALAKKSPEYLQALSRINLNIPTRNEVAWACRMIAGTSCVAIDYKQPLLWDTLFRTVITANKSIMLVGGRPGVDEGVQDKLSSHYAGLKILHTFHGYGEFEPKIAEVISRSPDVVLVDMKSPRQELFLLALADAGFKGMAITCDGYFQQYLAEDDYYPQWVERNNLHFLWDVCKIPPSKWGDHLSDYAYFISASAKALMNKLFNPWQNRTPVPQGK